MANFLNQSDIWTALESDTKPPASWNGTEYEIVTAGNPSYGLWTTSISEVGTLAGTVTLLAADPWHGGPTSFAISNGDPFSGGDVVYEQALSVDVPLAFEVPTLAENDGYWVYFSTGAGNPNLYYSFEALIAPTADPVPPVLGDPYIIRGTLRAYRGTDNPMTVYVRTEEGQMDLSAAQSLQAVVVGRAGGPGGFGGPSPDYGFGFPDWRPIVTVDASSPAPGRVTFTLTHGNLRTRLWGSLYTLFVRADNRTIYSALLEIV